MAEKYYQSLLHTSTKPKSDNDGGGGDGAELRKYEDAASFQRSGRPRSVCSARTGASMYSQVTKKSSDFVRTDIGSVERKVPLTQRISKFFWNPEDRTFLDRTGVAWTRLIIFYIAFYSVVAVFWAGSFALFDFAVLTEDRPVRTGDQSVLNLSPSMSYIPQPNYYTSLIRWRNSQYQSSRQFVDALVAFTQWYEDYGQQSIISSNEVVKDCSADGKNDDPVNTVCRFDLDVSHRCNVYINFGYSEIDPCFILKLNRVYGWVPDPIDSPDMTNSSNTGIIVRCQGRTETDREFYKEICYHYPGNGLDGSPDFCKTDYGVFQQYYFPYLRQVRYMSPLVFIEIRRVRRHVVLMMECWAEAKNIKVDRTTRSGIVQFEVLID